jgi:hypothetical protein
MAWYFFVFVPAKLDYFVGLRFRTLAVASAQIKSKADNFVRALDGAINPQGPVAATSGRPSRENVIGYMAALVPDVQFGESANPGLHISLSNDQDTYKALVEWPDVVRAASAVSVHDFDDLLVADSDGIVVWQRGKTTPRAGNLKELLSASPDPDRGWFALSWQIPSARLNPKQNPLPANATIAAVNVSGTSTYIFVQSLTLSPLGIDARSSRLYVAGLLSRRVLEQQAMQIPVFWLVLFALPVGLLFLALPFIKLVTLTPKERYSFGDITLLYVSTVCAVGIGAGLPFGPAGIDCGGDETLRKFAGALEERFAAEVGQVLTLAHSIEQNEDLLKGSLHECEHAIEPDGAGGTKQCGLWEALQAMDRPSVVRAAETNHGITPGSIELDVVAWLDRSGIQQQKWSTKAAVTTLVSHKGSIHLGNLQTGRTWTLADRQSAQRFTIEPLRTSTTAQMGTLIGLPVDTGRDSGQFLILNVTPHSLVAPVVPPGYGFAVLDEDGTVLFHSEESLSLQENFLAEVGDSNVVRSWLRSGAEVPWTGDYHGRPHRVYMRAMSAFVGCPWRLVTFQELGPGLDAQTRQQLAVLRLAALELILFLALVTLGWGVARLHGRSFRDLLLTPGAASGPGVGTLVALAILAFLMTCWTYDARSTAYVDQIYVFFAVLPLVAVLVATASRYWPRPVTGRLAPLARPGEVILLVLLTGAAPAIGFARVAYRVEDTTNTTQWLEEAARRWEERQLHVDDRVSRSDYGTHTRTMIATGGFAEPWSPNKRSCAAPFSYLDQIPRARLTCAVSDSPPRAAARQQFVRAVLGWSPFMTTTATRHDRVQATARGDELTFTPTIAGHSPIITARLQDGLARDLSRPRSIYGLAILIIAFGGLCWARRRLSRPSFLPSSSISKELSNVSRSGNEGVFLIGAPRTGKDQVVRRAVQRVAGEGVLDRIHLLDKDITDEYIATQVKRIDALIAGAIAGDPARRRPVWIHLSNAESQMVTAKSRTQLLQLLEKLLDRGSGPVSRVLVVTTSVDPIATFEDLFAQERKQIYKNSVPEVELGRSTLLLSRFRRAYLPLAGVDCATRWGHWLNYDPRTWQETLRLEVAGYEALEPIGQELRDAWSHDRGPSRERLARTIAAKAQATYELLWTSCTRSEKLVLIQLAQEGVVNPKCHDVIGCLAAKGLVVSQPGLTVFNYTFRRFLREIEREHIVSQWEHMEGTGVWVTAGRLIGSSMIAGGVFFLLTQDMSVQSLLPILSGTGVFGLPIVRDLLSRFTGRAVDLSKAA